MFRAVWVKDENGERVVYRSRCFISHISDTYFSFPLFESVMLRN